MMRTLSVMTMLVVLSLTIVVPAAFATRGDNGGRGTGPIIYVTSQDLFAEATTPTGPTLSAQSVDIGADASLEAPVPFAPGLITTFPGPNFDTNAAHTGFVFIPPDPIAAAV